MFTLGNFLILKVIIITGYLLQFIYLFSLYQEIKRHPQLYVVVDCFENMSKILPQIKRVAISTIRRGTLMMKS